MLLEELEMFDRDFVEVLNCELIIEGEDEGIFSTKRELITNDIFDVFNFLDQRN